jgi:aspartate aminotransferase
MADIQSQETGCPSSVAQHATIAALSGPQHCVTEMRHEYARRREFVCSRLRAINGITLFEPDGAFYAFFDVSSYFGKAFGGQRVDNSDAFCEAALTQAHVSFVSGAAFGCEGYVRMSYAAATKELHAGLDAFEKWLKSAN